MDGRPAEPRQDSKTLGPGVPETAGLMGEGPLSRLDFIDRPELLDEGEKGAEAVPSRGRKPWVWSTTTIFLTLAVLTGLMVIFLRLILFSLSMP